MGHFLRKKKKLSSKRKKIQRKGENRVFFPHRTAAELKRYQGNPVMYNFIDMYTLERIKENTGCCVTRTDDTRQAWDTQGIRYIGFAEEHHLLLMEDVRNGYILPRCKNSELSLVSYKKLLSYRILSYKFFLEMYGFCFFVSF
ncbi:uncharacterized protein NPIL_139501 [Nephila pilipes]|uniref:Uncharacterized protein n=1 Tax=Nephila pilipes TaxID=299642 RepID=A0A8X6JES6_NEPPI|nr:uncharacterized protein NPIL_139501 [Nephila pilipes]